MELCSLTPIQVRFNTAHIYLSTPKSAKFITEKTFILKIVAEKRTAPINNTPNGFHLNGQA